MEKMDECRYKLQKMCNDDMIIAQDFQNICITAAALGLTYTGELLQALRDLSPRLGNWCKKQLHDGYKSDQKWARILAQIPLDDDGGFAAASSSSSSRPARPARPISAPTDVRKTVKDKIRALFGVDGGRHADAIEEELNWLKKKKT